MALATAISLADKNKKVNLSPVQLLIRDWYLDVY